MTKYQFTGQFSNVSDFGLMYYRSRWYNSSLGRFAQADSIVPGGVQGWDRYAYVNNSPVRYTDRSGHMAACSPMEDDCHNDSISGNNGGGGNPHNNDSPDEDGLIPLPCTAAQACWTDNPPPTSFLAINFWKDGYRWLQLLEQSALYMDNYGIPAYRQAKGVVPGGPVLEFLLGAGTTFIGDLNNPNFTWGQTFVRSFAVGVEDGLIDAGATAGAAFLATGTGFVTLETGPGAAFAAGAVFFSASVGISKTGDAAAGAFNQAFLPGYFPKE